MQRSRGKREVPSAVFLVKRVVDICIYCCQFFQKKLLKGTEGPRCKVIAGSDIHETRIPVTSRELAVLDAQVAP
jgi:hypothetical protein